MTLEQTIIRELSCKMQAEQLTDTRDHTYLHASSIGSCRRAQGFALKGEIPLPHESHLISIFDLGNGIHREVQKRLVDMGWVKPENIELPLVNHEYRIKGTLDALTEPLQQDLWMPGSCWRLHPEDTKGYGDRFIIDIKTISSRPRLVRDDHGNIIAEEPSPFDNLQSPYKKHLMQVNLYAWMAKEQGIVEDFPRLMMLYIAKDCEKRDNEGLDKLLGLPYKVFVSDFDGEVLKEALKRAKHITEKIGQEELPTRDYYCNEKRTDWHCSVCSYRYLCYPEYFGDEPIGLSEESLRIMEEYRKC